VDSPSWWFLGPVSTQKTGGPLYFYFLRLIKITAKFLPVPSKKNYEREKEREKAMNANSERERDFYDIMPDILPAGLYRKPQHINPQAWYPVQWSTPIRKWRYI
jgi:hypothetical protein